MALTRRIEGAEAQAGYRDGPGLRGPRRSFSSHGRPDRRAIRRIVAALCLLLAFYCLLAAAATLSAQPLPGEPDPSAQAARRPLPLLIPLVFIAFLAVVAAVTRRGRKRLDRRDPVGGRPAD